MKDQDEFDMLVWPVGDQSVEEAEATLVKAGCLIDVERTTELREVPHYNIGKCTFVVRSFPTEEQNRAVLEDGERVMEVGGVKFYVSVEC